MHDVVILGSGCAGWTAALYLARANLKPLVLTGAQTGGLLTTTSVVENFPGFPQGIDGTTLMMQMMEQAQKFGAEVEFGVLADEVKLGRPVHQIRAGKREIEARVLIVATGAGHRHLGVPGEKELETKGVSYCATCDGALPMFRDQPVVVVGGGVLGSLNTPITQKNGSCSPSTLTLTSGLTGCRNKFSYLSYQSRGGWNWSPASGTVDP
jgi:thioredoxin reductase (NADPH)